MPGTVEVDVSTIFAPKDRMLLCSDGLRMLSEEEIGKRSSIKKAHCLIK